MARSGPTQHPLAQKELMTSAQNKSPPMARQLICIYGYIAVHAADAKAVATTGAFTPRGDPCPLPSAAACSRRRRGRPGRRRCRAVSARLPRPRARRPCEALTAPAAKLADSVRVTVSSGKLHCALVNVLPLSSMMLHKHRVLVQGSPHITSLACKLSSSPAKELNTGPTAPPPPTPPAEQG